MHKYKGNLLKILSVKFHVKTKRLYLITEKA